MDLGKNLRKLRRGAELTQEDLASYLGVTSQAVSKWECGDGYPEITLLPALAARFEVTIDALLGTDQPPDQRKIAEAIQKAMMMIYTVPGEEKFDEAIAIFKNLIDENPTVQPLRVQLASAYQSIAQMLQQRGGSEEQRLEYVRKAVGQYEYVIEFGDENTSWNAEFNVLQLYYELGEREKFNDLRKPRRNLLNNNIDMRTPDFARGNDRVFTAQSAIMNLAIQLQLMTMRLAQEEYKPGPALAHDAFSDDGEWRFTTEERIRILEKGLAIHDIVYEGNHTFSPGFSRGIADKIVELALPLGEHERVMRALQSLARDAVLDDQSEGINLVNLRLTEELFKSQLAGKPPDDLRELRRKAIEQLDPEAKALMFKPHSTSPLLYRLNRANLSSSASTAPQSFSSYLLDDLKDPKYDPLRADPRFTEIQNRINQRLGSPPVPAPFEDA
ncbi:MAG: helix-turn-helix domain-containing protein [Oscillospiraceae bacterium]|jgi:transcriptional regulator with XRE-family HTH domain|nr:helix-turn-helix domain-containing protein [Oscillospiraceae bacterium]